MTLLALPGSLKYGAEALFFLGAAYSIIRWVTRTVRESLGDARPDPASPIAFDGIDELTVYRALSERNIATPEQLAAMSARERRVLFDALQSRLAAAAKKSEAAQMASALPPQAQSTSRPTVPPAKRAPARPYDERTARPLVHCPACATPTPYETERPAIDATCAGCGRRVQVRIEGAQMVVTVTERDTRSEGSGRP